MASIIAPALAALALIATLALLLWLISLFKRDVSIIDSAWSLFQLVAALVYFAYLPQVNARSMLVLGLVALWSLRLAGYITARNWGHGEDHRYRAMRSRNEPHFALKSLYLVFGLQALLAWLLSFSTLAAMAGNAPCSWIDGIGVALFGVGFLFESIGDWQLARFKRQPANRNQVMQSGLWRYTRHPNYFGECCMAWGLYLLAVAAGGWWAIFAPLLITILLLKVSGVALLEKDIGERRPEYSNYMATTNAFIPGLPHKSIR